MLRNSFNLAKVSRTSFEVFNFQNESFLFTKSFDQQDICLLFNVLTVLFDIYRATKDTRDYSKTLEEPFKFKYKASFLNELISSSCKKISESERRAQLSEQLG